MKYNLQIIHRSDGRIEMLCKDHGVGHPIFAPKRMGKAGYIHGCDGCCSKEDFKEAEAEWKKNQKEVVL